MGNGGNASGWRVGLALHSTLQECIVFLTIKITTIKLLLSRQYIFYSSVLVVQCLCDCITWMPC